MNIRFSDDRSNPDSILYYAPPRYRRARGDSIRPVLERLSRGERWREAAPTLLPDTPDSEWLAPPDLTVLAPDPFSIVDRVATVAVCIAALSAGGVYLFASGDEAVTSTQSVAARMADRLVSQPAPVAVAVEPVAAPEPQREEPSAPKTAEPRSDIDLPLIAPLKMWGMFPTASDPAKPMPGQDANAAAEPPAAAPQARRQRRAHRVHASVSASETTEAQTASAQNGATQTAQVNPLQAAFRKIFGVKQ